MTDKHRVLVIGSNSFSGSDFIDLLLERERFDVVGLSRSPEKGPLFLKYKRHERPSFRFYQTDMNHQMDEMLRVVDDFAPEYVVNFAAQSEVGPSWDNPEHWFQTNTVALSLLIKHLSKCRFLQRYVHISSPEVYGVCEGTVTEDAPYRPSTPYAASKAAADLLLDAYRKSCNFPLLTIRATNVYGAHQQPWKIIVRAAIFLKTDRQIELHGGGTAVKSFLHIRDVSHGELAVMERGRVGHIYHLSPDRGYSVRSVVEKVCDRMGYDFDRCAVDVGERLGQDAAYVIDSSKARGELDWHPTIFLDQGLDEVIRWVEDNIDQLSRESLVYVHVP